MTKRTKKRSPKTILKLPDLEHSKLAVLNSLPSLNSRRSCDQAIRDFIDWYWSELRLAFNRTVVTRYRIALEQRGYAPSTINLRLAAVRRLAYEASDCGLLSPDLAAGIRRVRGAKRLGVRIGNWLSADQGKALVAAPAGLQLRVVRDRAVLTMLTGCGLRRAEFVTIKVEDFERREDHWVLADLIGKGATCGLYPYQHGSSLPSMAGPLSELAERGAVSRYRQDRQGLGFRVHLEGDLVDRPSSCL